MEKEAVIQQAALIQTEKVPSFSSGELVFLNPKLSNGCPESLSV